MLLFTGLMYLQGIIYRDIVVDSLNYSVEKKGLIIYSWVLMTNHIHLIIRSKKEPLENIMRDLKRYTSREVLKTIQENSQGSRKEWMLWLFERVGKKNANNTNYQFWQQNNHPIELGTESFDIDKYMDYIHENPVKA